MKHKKGLSNILLISLLGFTLAYTSPKKAEAQDNVKPIVNAGYSYHGNGQHMISHGASFEFSNEEYGPFFAELGLNHNNHNLKNHPKGGFETLDFMMGYKEESDWKRSGFKIGVGTEFEAFGGKGVLYDKFSVEASKKIDALDGLELEAEAGYFRQGTFSEDKGLDRKSGPVGSITIKYGF
ncbi:MAG: hypothetical protein ACQEP1_03995 [Nanobdellota archaeon]